MPRRCTSLLSLLLLVGLFFSAACQREREPLISQLPLLPKFVYQNRSSIELFHEADRLARQEPLSAERIGRLGMTYHAYRFTDEARQTYSLARNIAPNEYRWVYYQAFLEKSVYDFQKAESFFQQALEFKSDSAEVLAELGDLYLKWNRPDDAATHFTRALTIERLQPLAALGQARLALIAERWEEALALLIPILDTHPRLSLCHKYLARAYVNLGLPDKAEHHLSLSDYGSGIETPLMHELHELSVGPIVNGGKPLGALDLMQIKCTRCHTSTRIEVTLRDRYWWAQTVRRMQREAGWAWLSDEQAASIVAYLADREVSSVTP
jgi:tetratricopeptide (TPR) repeat protein